jgi:HEAT repeat protein
MLLAWTPAPTKAHAALARAALPGEPDPRVRRYAIQALGHTRLAEHRPVLMRALEDEAGEVRREATLGLSYLGGPVPLDELERMLRDSPPGQRPEVLTAIANDPGQRATDLLVASLSHADSHVETKVACVRLLAARAQGSLPTLIAALGDGDASVRVVTAQSLVERDDANAAVPALVQAFAARLDTLDPDSPTVAGWNELLALHEALRAITHADSPTLTHSPESWPPVLAAWRAVEAGE